LFENLVSQGKTIIIVTHDSSLAKRAQRTALLTDGEIVNEYVARALPSLSNAQLLKATRQLEKIKYDPGAMILQQGASGENFYIVSKGTVEIVLQREQGSDVIVAQLGPGKYFGEMEFFHERQNRASIRASENTPVEVVALDYNELSELLGESPTAKHALHEAAKKHEQENIQKRGKRS